ncbi:MAG: hypothetical protein Ct9H300mP11_16100 [Chloroflexota bacterium]|nr:MAG: hypothetical protein Ct9H300mP11_16100 [Chloroflexota bacterium]
MLIPTYIVTLESRANPIGRTLPLIVIINPATTCKLTKIPDYYQIVQRHIAGSRSSGRLREFRLKEWAGGVRRPINTCAFISVFTTDSGDILYLDFNLFVSRFRFLVHILIVHVFVVGGRLY